MAIALRAAQGSNNAGGAATITMTVPTGTTDDDLMLMAVSVRGGTGCTITPPGFWTTITNPWNPTAVNAAGYGNGTLVAIETNGEVGTSTDFLTVTPSGVSPLTSGVRGVAYGNGLWVVVGPAGAMKTATDPTGTWTSRTSQFGATDIAAVHYDNGIWVAVGSAGKISTSTNGTTWTAETTVTAENYLSISYGNGVWVAAGGNNIMATATDPTGTWTVNANAPGTGTIGGTAYSPIANRWVATPDGQPYYTTDPTGTWTISANDVFSGSMYYVAYGNGVFVASDSVGDVGSSSDGITWFKEVTSGPSGAQDVVYGNGKFFLASSLDGTKGLAVGTSWGQLDRADSTTVLAQGLYTKVAFQEPASYAVTITSEKASGVIIALSGADLSAMETTQYGDSVNASNANVTAPALSGFTASSGIDVMFAGTATGTTIAPQASPAYTEPANGESASTGAGAGTRTTTEVEYLAMTNVTSAASVVAVASAAAVNIGHHVFVKDPTPPAGDFPTGHRSRRSASQLIAA